MQHFDMALAEEQLRLITELTKAPRQEILKTINLSKVNLGDIIACLVKINHYDNLPGRSQRKKQGH
jgi:hypothetical protein